MTETSNKKEKILIIAAVVIMVLLAGIFLVIQLSSKEYLVKFNTNGGSPIESVKVKENHKVEKPDDPTKNGYIFAGWYYNDKEFDFDTKITKDITLEAYWSENGIILNTNKMSILLGDEKKVGILSLPEDVKMQDLVYSSSDEEVLTVDAEGNIKTLKEGTATITIKTKDGKHTVKLEITVTKEEVYPKTIAIFGFETMAIGETIRLGITYEPDDATNLNFKWTSDNTAVATVDQLGNVTGVGEGKATITAESENGLTATHSISVYKYEAPNQGETKPNDNKPNPTPGPTPDPTPEPTPDPTPDPTPTEVTGVTISGQNEVNVGSTIILSASVTPANATNKTLTWSSNNTGVATVDQNGRVTGVSEGTATITATAANGKSVTYDVKVHSVYTIYITAIPLEGGSLNMGSIQYNYKVMKDARELLKTEFKGFTYNGVAVSSASSTVPLAAIGESKTAELKLSDNSIVTASVIMQ